MWLYVCPLRTMVFIAISNEWLTLPIWKYSNQEGGNDTQFPDEEDLAADGGQAENAKQELYRDLYLFCAFTGLSFADMRESDGR